MNHDTPINRHTRRWLASLLALAAVGLVLLVVTLSTTGGGAARRQTSPGGPTPSAQVAKVTRHAARPVKATRHAVTRSAPAAQPSSAIPQQNGGDGDADNNGGPSDGDGNI